MFETLFLLPASFWVVILLLIAGAFRASKRTDDGTGLPILTVLGTVTAWYVGDAFYNDYANNHAKLFDAGTLADAWWQVALFLCVFLAAVPIVHRSVNGRYLNRRSGIFHMFNHGVGLPEIQKQLSAIFTVSLWIWIILLLIALVVLKAEIVHYLFPFWGYKASPWSHGRVGVGLDFLSIPAIYLNLLVAQIFGVVGALAMQPRIRRYALWLCLLTWPYFIFDRTRNTMLAVVIPGVLCWVFLRLRGTMLKKVAVLLVCFLVVNFWMKFVIANRSDMSIVAAFQQKGLNLSEEKNVHNEGLNMYEELCWISTFIDNGSYNVNWGARYFAELVNPIPRAFWPGKPLIGLDYAKARGHAEEDDTQGGVNTTIATGLIGQGVVNFGRVLGPTAAALLMSLWVACLARLDLNIHALGRLPLYSLGLILTFNMGRDITLIILYPFVFGAMAIWWLERYYPALVAGTSRLAEIPVNRGPAGSEVSNRDLLFVRRTTVGGFIRRKWSVAAARGSRATPAAGRNSPAA